MNVTLSAAFEAADATARHARFAANVLWERANSADGDEQTALIRAAEQLDIIAEQAEAAAEAAADAFLASGGVLGN